MKKFIVLLVLLAFTSICFASESGKNIPIKTGDDAVDQSLDDINSRIKTSSGAIEVKKEIKEKLSVTDREINFLNKQGYTLAQIYYLASLAKASGKKVNDVAAMHSKGVGWGVLARRLGVRPDALRKLIVQEKKTGKMMMREKRKKK
jgi:hypothetical protein